MCAETRAADITMSKCVCAISALVCLLALSLSHSVLRICNSCLGSYVLSRSLSMEAQHLQLRTLGS